MIAADLLDLLRCPLTLQPLALAEPDLVTSVNARCPDAPPLQAALLRADRALLYPVVDGIAVLLPDSGISV